MNNTDKLTSTLQDKDPVTDIVIRDYHYWHEEMLCSVGIDDQSENSAEAVARYRTSTLRITLRRIARKVYGIDWRELD